MEQILNHQVELHKSGNIKRMFIIFDDILGAKFNGKMLTQLFSQYRHYNITIFVATQYFNKLPPLIRENAAYMILFRCENNKTLRKVWEEFMAEKEFEEAKRYLMNSTAADYSHVMIQKGAPIKSKYSSGKAKAVPKYKFVF